jgi:ATP-dependent Lon protease
VPANVREGLKIIPVSHVDEVLKVAFARPVEPIEWNEADEKAVAPVPPAAPATPAAPTTH